MSDFVKEKTEQGFTMKLSLDPHTFEGFVDVGFTRGFASSQAFRDKFPKDADIDEIGKTIIPGDLFQVLRAATKVNHRGHGGHGEQ